MNHVHFSRLQRDAERLRLSIEDQAALAEKAKSDPKARARLVEGTLYLVVGILVGHFRRYQQEWDDMAMVGALELVRVVDNFEPGKGRLDKYACTNLFNIFKNHINKNINTVRRALDRRTGTYRPALTAVYTDGLERGVQEMILGETHQDEPVTPTARLFECLGPKHRMALFDVLFRERMVKDIATDLGVSSARITNMNLESLAHLRGVVETGKRVFKPDQKNARGMSSCHPDRFHYSRGYCGPCYQRFRYSQKRAA